VLVSKYADHLPLYRQAQIYQRQGLRLDRSTLADWVGRAAFHLRPVHERILAHLKSSTKLFADETTAHQWLDVFETVRMGAFRELDRMRDEGVIRAWGLGVNRVEPIEWLLELDDPRPDGSRSTSCSRRASALGSCA
jgi:hypothetical protein